VGGDVAPALPAVKSWASRANADARPLCVATAAAEGCVTGEGYPWFFLGITGLFRRFRGSSLRNTSFFGVLQG
jgi:hypothetical protein